MRLQVTPAITKEQSHVHKVLLRVGRGIFLHPCRCLIILIGVCGLYRPLLHSDVPGTTLYSLSARHTCHVSIELAAAQRMTFEEDAYNYILLRYTKIADT